jgi:hypothetical protein
LFLICLLEIIAGHLQRVSYKMNPNQALGLMLSSTNLIIRGSQIKQIN